MALLSMVRDSSILENNIVQTVASAAGTLSAIIFVLPGLVIVGWWTGFPFWTSFLICVAGGILGVLFTIPLRRALVTTSDLPYPEGVAAAEVLKVGSGTRGETKDDTGEAREGLMAVIYGSVASAGLAIVSSTRVAAAAVTGFFSLGANAGSGYDIAFSLALLGAGHLVGLSVGMAMLTGLLISWAGAVPILTSPAAGGRGRRLRRAHRKHLAASGALHRRRHDCDLRDLDARSSSRSRSSAASISTIARVARDGHRRRARPRSVARLDRRPHDRVPRAVGVAVRQIRRPARRSSRTG